MTTTHVRSHLESLGWQGRILEFPESSATVELAAMQAGTEPRRIAKTLGFYDPEEPTRAVLVVAAGDAKVNGGKYKRQFGGKPRMLAGDDVLPFTGHPIGGVCPFAVTDGTRVVLDVSLQRFATVFPAAGTACSAVELAIPELEQFSGSDEWVDVCTGWQDEDLV